jgi:hypothetical protein
MNNQANVDSVAITWTDKNGAAQSSSATVLALDAKTIKLAVQEALKLMGPCTIAFTSTDATKNQSVQATIHHARWRGEDYQVTCELVEPLTEAGVQQLASCCNIDRRVFARRPTNIDVRLRPELCAGAMIPVRIVDLSEGGCCVQSPQEVPVGIRARLISLDEADCVESITLRIRWKRPCEQGFLFGCQSVCHRRGLRVTAVPK